jgi:hypothetical protein
MVTVQLGAPVYCGLTVAVTVTLCPCVIELDATTSEVVLLALLTVCGTTFEMLPEFPLSPAKTAVIAWDPRASDDVPNVATPELFRVLTPRVVDPSLNVTASPLPEAIGVLPLLTVAVKVIGWPKVDGFTEDERTVVVVAWLTVRTKFPLLVAWVLSPL